MLASVLDIGSLIGRRPCLLRRLCCVPALCAALLTATPAVAEPTSVAAELEALTLERETLARELAQYKKTLAVLHSDGSVPLESGNPAVRTLAQETVRINERIIAIAEREVALLEQQIVQAEGGPGSGAAPQQSASPPAAAMESKLVRTGVGDFSAEEEQRNVARLYQLLNSHYAEAREAAETQPTEEELAERQAAMRDAETLSKIPFNADKVRLSGAEGSMALSQITVRLSDPGLPESRRDIAPICSIKTRLFGSLIASETRGLTPVGKHHYLARIRLQPGNTMLRIQGEQWEVRLPQDINAGDYVLTYYSPPGSTPELHVFAVDDLLAESNPHLPPWLPDTVKLKPRAG